MLRGDGREMFDRLGELGVAVQLLPASSAGPPAIDVFDGVKEEPAHRHRTMIWKTGSIKQGRRSRPADIVTTRCGALRPDDCHTRLADADETASPRR
jgi:hypothetical protein